MAQRGEALDSRVARLEEIVRLFMDDTKEYRTENKADVKDIIARLDGLRQAQESTSTAVRTLTMQDAGARLAAHDAQIKNLEERIAQLTGFQQIADDVKFWRRVFGGGWRAISRLAGLLVASGLVGALVQKYWP